MASKENAYMSPYVMVQDAMRTNAASPQAADQHTPNTSNTTMVNATMSSLSDNKLMERASSNSARKTIKRTMEEDSDYNDDGSEVLRDDEYEQPQPAAVRKPTRKKLRKSIDDFVRIGQHVDEPRVIVKARLQDRGRLWIQGFQEGSDPQLADWEKYVTPNGQVKAVEIKLDAAIIGDYDGVLSREKACQLIKKYLRIVKGISPDLPAKIVSRTIYEPSQLEVGFYSDGKSLVFAKMVAHDHISDILEFFLDPESDSKFQSVKEIKFHGEYRRESFNATQAYIRTFFKAQVVAEGSTPPKLESDTVMSQEFEDALEDAEVPERDQDSAQIESLLGPEFQAAFEAAKDSLRNLESVTKNFKDDKEGHIQGLMTELDQRQEILEDLSLTIRNHETTILKQKSDIDDLGTVMATEVEARDRTIAELQAKVQQPSLVNGANQPATASPSVTNAASSDSRIKELEKKLKKSEAENQKQAQNIADFVADPENFKIVHLTKLEAKNQEKDDRIQSLEAELLKARSEVEQLQRVSSNPASIKSVDTHGLRFQDAFVKVPDEVSKASLYKERVTPKFSDENNRWWQQTRMLQDGIVIAGTSSDRVETINGATYDCYEEKGKQKRLKHVDENSLVKHDGKFYVSWEILKETEPEEPDFDY